MNTIEEKVKLLEVQLQDTEDPVLKADLLNEQAYELRHSDASLSMKKSREAGELAQHIGYQKGIATALLNEGFSLMVQADYNAAFPILYKAGDVFETIEDKAGQAHALYNIGIVYSRIGEYNQALEFFQQSLAIRKAKGDMSGEAACLMQLAYIYDQFGNEGEASDYYQNCLSIRREIKDMPGIAAALVGTAIIKQKRGEYKEAEEDLRESLAIRQEIGETHGWLVSMNYLGELFIAQKDYLKAAAYLEEAIDKAKKQTPPFPANLCRLYTSLSRVHTGNKDYEKAICILQLALQTATKSNLRYLIHDIHLTLSGVYKQVGDFRQALNSYEQFHLLKEEVINLSASAKLKNLELSNEIQAEKKEAEIHRLRHIELKEAYIQLQKTQEQLIQVEKLAYLGHLIAGIAHEIQNPLNFVNNFSEVSVELLEEWMTDVKEKGAGNEVNNEFYTGIKNNLEKISYHGRRADSIVKSMLQHSRASNDQKEPTDINALIDEYLRLSYEAMRAKDKSFIVSFHTELDPTIGKVNIIPQDIGRVLLNLFNNSFYAVKEKKKSVPSFEPSISIKTKKNDEGIAVIVRDNGIGIDEGEVNKIYQPFYTTKPTGEGTGLGLSLSYDIITKGHSGFMKAKSEKGEYTEFIVQLPV
ncbi:MAG TPA: tetratricopeptide repeat protein [Chitinophagaceae bacterium]|nr:tetratricopeptide repeat protein [Chitinophagaceae bacterium]